MKYLILLVFLPFSVIGQNFFWSYSKPPTAVVIPTVTTTAITSIGENDAYSGGNVTSDGGGTVTARGVAFGLTANPSVMVDSWTTDGSGSGSFTSYIYTLSPNITYHVRAYATNSAGTAYGSDVVFTTACNSCFYYYNWYAMTTTGNIAPSGWHVPTSTEISTLATYLLGASVAGGKLKETGTTHWTTPNTGATNSSGFTALGSGYITTAGNGMLNIKQASFMWCSDLTGVYPYGFYLDYNNSILAWAAQEIRYGFAVRLIKDDSTDPGTMTGNDGKTYTTVKIGNQVWINTNLRETKYRDGSAIYVHTYGSGTAWQNATSGMVIILNTVY